jgi:hypothetical protein
MLLEIPRLTFAEMANRHTHHSMIDEAAIEWLVEHVGPILHEDKYMQRGTFFRMHGSLDITQFSKELTNYFAPGDATLADQRYEIAKACPQSKICSFVHSVIGDGWSYEFNFLFDTGGSSVITMTDRTGHHFFTIDDESQAFVFKLTWL